MRRERYRAAMAAPRPHGGFVSRWDLVEGVAVHARVSVPAAPGRAVVLVHGVAVSHRYLVPLARELAGAHPVHLVDLPGFGLSGDPGRVLGVTGLADALHAWLLRAGPAAPVLCANSFGCQVVVDLVARHPEVASALVLIGPTMDPYARTGPRQVLRWLRNLRHEDLFQLRIIARDLRDAGIRRAVLTFAHALRDPVESKLPAVGLPTLVTRGALEPVVSPRWAREAADLLPRGELAVVPDSPHDANYSAPDRLAAVVLPFLAGATGDPGAPEGVRPTVGTPPGDSRPPCA